MNKIDIHIPVFSYQWEELSEDDRTLIKAAREASHRSYAPYSRFSVGAALRLANGQTVTGNNQENAAYPSGTCAERCTVFYASARYPDVVPVTLAIAARGTDGLFTAAPITPCGACRQVLIETEKRYRHPLRILLYGTAAVYEIASAGLLVPLQFDAGALVPTE